LYDEEAFVICRFRLLECDFKGKIFE
jgi:hypothetical protein